MASGQAAVSKENAEHYTWGQQCDGWYLVKDDQMTIIEERMPPGTAETLHQHAKSRQFFFVLAGSAVMEHGGAVTTLAAGTGIEIPPGCHLAFSTRQARILKFWLLRIRPAMRIGSRSILPCESSLATTNFLSY